MTLSTKILQSNEKQVVKKVESCYYHKKDKIMIERKAEMEIRPVSDLRNHFTEIESIVKEGNTVYLTKNGYGSMVVLSLEAYSNLTDRVELALDQADLAAKASDKRMKHDEVFGGLRRKLNGK